jgi:hypothetical protein
MGARRQPPADDPVLAFEAAVVGPANAARARSAIDEPFGTRGCGCPAWRRVARPGYFHLRRHTTLLRTVLL